MILRPPPLCPMCKRPIDQYEPWRGWSVNLLDNYADGPNGVEVKLPPMSAAALYLLLKKKGNWATLDYMIAGLWAEADEPAGTLYAVKEHIRVARKLLKPHGISIVNGGKMWAIDIPPPT